MIGEPQRMHSAVVPGSSSSTRWASPQVSQARTDSWLAMGLSTVSRRTGFLLYISPSALRSPHEACADRCSGIATGRLRLQPAAVAGRAGEGRLVRSAEPVRAPRRPDREPGEHGEGLRRPGAAGADRRDRGACQGDLDQRHARARQRYRRLPAVRAGAARGHRRALAPARRSGELPPAQVRPELPRAAGAARGHREPHRGRAPALHQGGAGVQHQRAPIPGEPHRDALRLQAQAPVQRRGREGDRQAAERRFRLAEEMTLRGVAALVVAALLSLLAWALDVPPLKARVTDLTGTLNAPQHASLEQTLAEFEARKGAQLAVLIVPSTQPETVEQYAVRVEEAWKLGRKGVDDSVLLVVAKDDRRLKFEVGYGLEGVLPDAIAKRIIDNDIVPRFREGDFYGGIRAGMDRVMRVVEGEKLPPPAAHGPTGSQRLHPEWLFALFLFVAIGGSVLRAIFGRVPGAGIVGTVAGLVGWALVGSLVIGIIAALIGF